MTAVPKNTRYNIYDNFEDVYLRSRTLQKVLQQFTTDEINNIIAKPHFKKCINHVSYLAFKKNKSIYFDNGFAIEDLRNIAMVFGLCYYLYHDKNKTEKDECYLLMRYVNQRFIKMKEWVTRKFGHNEKVLEFAPAPSFWNTLIVDGVYDNEDIENNDSIDNHKVFKRKRAKI